MGTIELTEDDVVVPLVLAAFLDENQDTFNDEQKDWDSHFEEKRKSSTMPDLERAPGKADNWVEKAGGLPKYIERIAKHLHYEQGMSIGHAIAAAVNTIKRWAKGGGNVKPDTVAKAQAALAEWEAKKAKGKKDIMGDTNPVDGIEYKNVGVKGIQVADDATGVVEAIVSVTGIVDEVKDIIKPGAYAKTLAKRLPKGVYSHSWDRPVSKTLDIKELFPGDPRLPDTLANGAPWPKEAGALWVKMQFNLKTDNGRNAFEEVKFYGSDQEWSIGYNVPVGGAKVLPQKGVREIETLDLFEYSPVLFGAMPLAATQSVKSAQTAFKAMAGAGQWTVPDWTVEDLPTADEVKAAEGDITVATNETDVPSNLAGDDKVGVFEINEDGIVDADLDEYEGIEVEDIGQKAIFGPDDLDVAVKAYNAINDLLAAVTGFKAHSQVPGDDVAAEGDTGASGGLAEAVKTAFPDDSALISAAEAVDTAVSGSDTDAANEAASAFLDLVEERMDVDGADTESLTKVAKMVASMVEVSTDKEPPSEDTTEGKTLETKSEEDTNEVIDLSILARLRGQS